MVATRSSLQAPSSSSTLQGRFPYKKKRSYRKVSRICVPTKAPAVPSPPVPSIGSNEDTPLCVSTSTNASKPPPPVPPLGSTSDRTLLIPCDEEEEQRETKLKLNPLSRLKAAKETHTNANGHSSQMHEKSKKVISDEVKSMLVSHLTSGMTTSVDDMVTLANHAFTTLNWFGAYYGSFYKDVKDLIACKYDLLIIERKLDMLSIAELEKKYLDIVIFADDIEEEIEHIQVNQKMDEEKK
ncbi:uncharacterized protein LOC129888584 [Solanum dulcamara]|uniref:uncharacterized protein LOC129888584 n=1 Tax=Solanum dulcamara TaxID=45834 RepID=UPI0024868C59|nr:uncharacterized protein LOC129888584 [Solanum dulcamara]